MDQIRNFSIIAHIDHGKSTLADRLIQRCGGLSDREMEAQVLDSMDIERERGITIKAQTAALSYTARDGRVYNLNLIDTPGHVDFSYEVSRSLSACEGALLVVDASQGVEAQTVANCYTALDLGVEVVPVLNKMDLPQADPDRAREEIEDVIGIDAEHAIPCSAKTGEGIDEILEAVVQRMPAPRGKPDAPLRASPPGFAVHDELAHGRDVAREENSGVRLGAVRVQQRRRFDRGMEAPQTGALLPNRRHRGRRAPRARSCARRLWRDRAPHRRAPAPHPRLLRPASRS